MTRSLELTPCPKCGSTNVDAQEVIGQAKNGDTIKGYHVVCKDCLYHSPIQDDLVIACMKWGCKLAEFTQED